MSIQRAASSEPCFTRLLDDATPLAMRNKSEDDVLEVHLSSQTENLDHAGLHEPVVRTSASVEDLSVQCAARPEPAATRTLDSAEPLTERNESQDVLEVQLSSHTDQRLDAMTVRQLKAFAAEVGVTLQGLSTKKQMVQKLRTSGFDANGV